MTTDKQTMSHAFLQFFDLRDAVQLVLLICLLRFVGQQMGEANHLMYWSARTCGVVIFALYVWLGIEAWNPRRAEEFLSLGVRALLAMGIAHALARIVLSILLFFYRILWLKPLAQQRAWAQELARRSAAAKAALAEAEQRQAEQLQLAELQRQREEELARRPPPPTREELMAAAKQRYESRLHALSAADLDELELRTAKEKAKQQYLREIDGVIK